MREFSLDTYPEVFVSDASISHEVSRAYGQGRLRKLASRLYTRNLIDPPPRRWFAGTFGLWLQPIFLAP